MGASKFGGFKGSRKKVARLAKFAAGVAINGELPPAARDESEREFYESMGVIMLDESELELMGVFFRCLEFERVYRLNLTLLREYCEREELDFLLTHEMLSPALGALAKEYYKKAHA